MLRPIDILKPKQDRSVSKSRFYSIINLWPTTHIDTMGWLSNFTQQEKPFAFKLLDSFLYFNDAICDELMRDSISSLSRYVIDFKGNAEVALEWEDFINNTIVVPIMGEDPSLADSGLAFTRLARNVLGFEESQLKTPAEAIPEMYWGHLKNKNTKLNVIFVDDFIGTGSQFIEAWRRPEVFQGVPMHSFEELAKNINGIHFYYCPLFATNYGLYNIKKACHGVIINPAHIIDEEYSALSPKSKVWGELPYREGVKFLANVAQRAGMPDTRGKCTEDWRGYHKLGLCIAFKDSAPDASLAIFRWKDNWIPLFKK